MLSPIDDEDDCADTMTRSTMRRTLRGVLGDLGFNFGLFRTFGNSRWQSAIKAFRMWRGETVYIMPQRSAFHSRLGVAE